MTREERLEITQVVNAAIRNAMSSYEEKWLCTEDFCAQFQMFTPSWLKKNGHLLTRTRIHLTDEKGNEHKSVWAYPRNEIQELIRTNKLRFICKNKNAR